MEMFGFQAEIRKSSEEKAASEPWFFFGLVVPRPANYTHESPPHLCGKNQSKEVVSSTGKTTARLASLAGSP